MQSAISLDPKIVSHDDWLIARRQLLTREKQLTGLRDEIDAARRNLPWTKIEKNYSFDGPNGEETLSDLFAGRSQLVIQHFMFGPEWNAGCVGCSFKADHVDGSLVHLENHDVTFVAVSRAPYSKLDAFKKRMGWRFKWVSAFGSDFNYDFQVSFTPEDAAAGQVLYNYECRPFESEEGPGNSVFFKDQTGAVFHTYSTFGRGDEMLDTTYMYLDLTPKGRNETGPAFNLMDWVKYHDRYEVHGTTGATCHGNRERP